MQRSRRRAPARSTQAAVQPAGPFRPVGSGRARPKRSGRKSAPWALLAVLLLPVLGCAPADEAPRQSEILWDTWGVPHVFAESDEMVFYANGWAQAQAHGDLLLRLYGEARGRAAEYWGEDELESDRWVRTVGISERAERWLAEQTPREHRFLDAFVAGINAYAMAHPDQVADTVEPVLPVRAVDVLAHVQRVIHFTFMVHPGEIAAARRQWLAGLQNAALGSIGPGRPSWSALPSLPARPARPGTGAALAGSNAWALAPARSASGHALLLANPHLPWSGLFTWFEIQLTGPSIDAYGATLVGTPFLGIAFNDHLGWTHTVNTLDGYDLYELELADGGYRWAGGVRPFETEEQTIRVRTADGSLHDEPLTVRRSVHGPVVAEARTPSGGRALALRVAGLDQPHLTDQYWEMATAENLGELESAVRQLQMPMFTVIYADRDGHILHLFGGRVPERPALSDALRKAGWSWSGVVPGTGPETLWTTTYPYEDLPRVLDPASGWLQNANDPPWTTTFPRALDPSDYPEGIAPRFMSFRAQRSAALVSAAPPVDLDELVRRKHSTEMGLADRLLDDLADGVAAHGDARARRAMAVLSAWDRTADATSRGGVLFQRFVQLLDGAPGEPFATPWSTDRARSTPDGLANPAGAAAALSRAARETEATYGDLAVPWGDVHRLRGGGRDLPANGGDGALGIFRVVNYAPVETAGEEGLYRAAGGDSYVAAVEMADPIRARVLLSYGNATQPGSRHLGDQLELFAAKELRPVWRTREEIAPHVEMTEALRVDSEALAQGAQAPEGSVR